MLASSQQPAFGQCRLPLHAVVAQCMLPCSQQHKTQSTHLAMQAALEPQQAADQAAFSHAQPAPPVLMGLCMQLTMLLYSCASSVISSGTLRHTAFCHAVADFSVLLVTKRSVISRTHCSLAAMVHHSRPCFQQHNVQPVRMSGTRYDLSKSSPCPAGSCHMLRSCW